MLLYLLRHADADPDPNDDQARPLSGKGIAQAKRVGRFCREHEIFPEHILTSPLLRARETAEYFASDLGETDPEIAEFLSPGMTPETAITELKAYGKDATVLLVGHLPDLALLATHLLGLPDPASLHIRKASLTLIDLHALRPGAGELEFVIPCRLM